MAEYDIDSLVRDPDFQRRSFAERKAILREADSEGFGALPEPAQSRMLVDMKGQDWWQGGRHKVVTGNMEPTAVESAKFRRQVVKDEGTLLSRVRDTSPGEAVKNTLLEIPRLAQEFVTVPLSSAKKGAYGIGSLAKTGGAMIRGKSLDEALQVGTDAMKGYEPIHGPLDPSMTGELIGTGIEKGINSAESATGNTGWAGAGIQATADIAGLIGGGKALAKVGKKGAATLGDLREGTRPAATELQTLSRQHNVPLTAGEELGSPNLKQVEARLERLPVLGIRGMRKKQGEALAQSAQNLADEFATAVEDPATALTDRFKSNLKRAKEESSQAYAKIDEALAENGDPGAIEPIATRTQTKALLAKSPDIFERLPGSQNRLKSIMAEIVGDTSPKKAGIEVAPEFGTVRKHGEAPKLLLGPDGKPIARQTTPKLSYEDYTWLRSQLGEYIDRAHSSAGAVGSNELRQLTIIKKALDTDFYRWGKNSGYENVTAAVDNARNVYKTKVAPFDNVPVLKSIVNDKFTPEQLLDAIAKPGQATLATRAMRGLTESDKGLVQDAIMRRAMATSLEGSANGAPISGAKFATFFEKMDTKTKNAAQSPMDVFFSPAQKQQVMGFAKLARAAERSGQYAANPLTGVAAADFAIPTAIGTTAATVGAPAALTTAAFTKGLSLLLTTPRGKALLHRAYRTPAGAKGAWTAIMSDAQRILKDQRGLVGKDIDAVRNPQIEKNVSLALQRGMARNEWFSGVKEAIDDYSTGNLTKKDFDSYYMSRLDEFMSEAGLPSGSSVSDVVQFIKKATDEELSGFSDPQLVRELREAISTGATKRPVSLVDHAIPKPVLNTVRSKYAETGDLLDSSRIISSEDLAKIPKPVWDAVDKYSGMNEQLRGQTSVAGKDGIRKAHLAGYIINGVETGVYPKIK
jgi:hypothetical protein